MHLLLKEIRHNPLFWMLIFVPIVLAVEIAAPSAHTALFVLAVLAIVPLAALLSHATESVAEKTGDAVGGLLNATLGNLTELIIAIAALHAGQYMLVTASIAGAIVTNSLFMLGASFLLGGLRHHVQEYNRAGGRMYAALLLMATVALLAPAAVADLDPARGETMAQTLSTGLAVLLVCAYRLSLLFSLKTHKELFASDEHGETGGADCPIGLAFGTLIVVTVLVALVSEIFVSSVQKAGEALGLSPAFIGFIIVALVGAAAEMAVCIFCGAARHERQHRARKRFTDRLTCCAGPGSSELRDRSEANGLGVLARRRDNGHDRLRYVVLDHQQRAVGMVHRRPAIFAMTLYMVPPGSHAAV